MAPPGGPAPAGPDPMAMAAPGGAAPVNFRQGGAVQYFADENEERVVKSLRPRLRSGLITETSLRPKLRTSFEQNSPVIEAPVIQADGLDQSGSAPGIGGRQGEIFRDQQALYRSLINPEDDAAAFEEQKNMTKAQMLFDIAQGALAFATPGETQMSPAERLAQVAQPVLGNIGARSGELLKFKQAQDAKTQQLDMAALQASGSLYGAERSAELADGNAALGDVYKIDIMDAAGELISTSYGPLSKRELSDLRETAKANKQTVDVTEVPKPSTASPKSAENFTLSDGSLASAVPGTAKYARLVKTGAIRTATLGSGVTFDREQVTMTMDVKVGDVTFKKGTSPNFNKLELNALISVGGADAYTKYVAPISDNDYFDKFKMSKAEFDKLTKNQQEILTGTAGITNVMYFNKFGVDKNTFLQYDTPTQHILLGIDPEYRYERITGDDGTLKVVQIDVRSGETKDLLDEKTFTTPNYFSVTLTNAAGQEVTSVVDINTNAGAAMVKKVNKANDPEQGGTIGSAAALKVATQSVRPQGFYVPKTEENPSGVVTSFDGGRTYTNANGEQVVITEGFKVSDTIAFSVNRTARVSGASMRYLETLDNELSTSLNMVVYDANGEPKLDDKGAVVTTKVKLEDGGRVRDSLALARKGTGFWSKVNAGIDGLLGGVINPEYFGKMFADTQDARQFVEMVRILGRSALASSPRFAIADLEATEKLFPTETAFFRNPVTESKKLVRLAEELQSEKERIHNMRIDGVPIDSALASQHSQKLYEISRLEGLLGPILTLRKTVDQKNLDKAAALMDAAVDN